MKSKTADTDGTIIEFLNGSHSYEGVWFGDKHRTKEGTYWWRKILRDYVESSQLPPPVPDEAPKEWEEQATKDYENGYESETSAIDKFMVADEAGEVSFDDIINVINPNNNPSFWTDEMVKQAMTMALNKSMFNRWVEIKDIRTMLLTHPDKEMIESCCLHFLGDKVSPAPPSGEDAGKGWISVEDEMPIAYKTGVWDGQKSDLVLTYNAVDDTHCIATLYEGYLDGNHFKDWYHVDDFEIPTPTHWKPLTAPKP